jgi:glutamyl-tRNA synthetase
MNGVYLRDMPEDELVEIFSQRLERDLPADIARPFDRTLVEAFTPLVRERIKLLSELAPMVEFFFRSELTTTTAEVFLTKRWKCRADDAVSALNATASYLRPIDIWETASIEEALRAAANEVGERPGDFFSLSRLAVTGAAISPPLFESMEIIGKGLTIERIEAAADSLRSAE